MNTLPGDRLFPFGAPWGWRTVMAAAFIGLGLFLSTSLIVAVVIAVIGSDPVTSDYGDTFEIAGRIVEYTDQRMQAIAAGRDLPDPPLLKADIVTIRAAFIVTPLYQLATIALVIFASRRPLRTLWRDFGMHMIDARSFWLPAATMVAVYVGVAIYATVMEAIGQEILVPESTVPGAVTRDSLALALAGVAAVGLAPISEELFYRGLLLGGLLRFGFWPAAAITSALFSLTHLDPGSLIPFFAIGLVLAWLAWHRGSLWDAIIFHFMFNGTSYVLLLLLEA